MCSWNKFFFFFFFFCYKTIKHDKAPTYGFSGLWVLWCIKVSCPCCFSQLLSAMVAKLGNMDEPLPQESFEGVDEDEWVSALWR